MKSVFLVVLGMLLGAGLFYLAIGTNLAQFQSHERTIKEEAGPPAGVELATPRIIKFETPDAMIPQDAIWTYPTPFAPDRAGPAEYGAQWRSDDGYYCELREAVTITGGNGLPRADLPAGIEVHVLFAFRDGPWLISPSRGSASGFAPKELLANCYKYR